MEQKGTVDFVSPRYRVSLMLAGGGPGGQLRPVIGMVIPKRLARRFELDSDHVWVQKDGQEGGVLLVRGRCNDISREFRVPVEELNLLARQKKRLGLQN